MCNTQTRQSDYRGSTVRTWAHWFDVGTCIRRVLLCKSFLESRRLLNGIQQQFHLNLCRSGLHLLGQLPPASWSDRRIIQHCMHTVHRYTYIYIYICTKHPCKQALLHTHTHTNTHTHIPTYIHTHARTHARMHARTHAHTHNTHISIYTHIRMYIDTQEKSWHLATFVPGHWKQE